MNFQDIPPVETPKDLIDLAFRKAREKGVQKKLAGNWLQVIRTKEMMKLDIVKDTLNSRLSKILHAFPSIELPPFYLSLMKLTLDYPSYKKSCGAVNWAMGKIRFFHKSSVQKISKEKERQAVTEISRQCYGRMSSILQQIKENLAYLEHSRKVMRTYPDVKDMFTVCIYGFPNVGKTTLLNTLAQTKAEVAAYAFTTKTINSGFMKLGNTKIQLLDVPGTLARKDKLNIIEQQAELVARELADVIVYVFDLSETSGYSIKKQEQLLQQLGKRTVLVYLSKQDLLSKENIALFSHRQYSLSELRDKIASLAQNINTPQSFSPS